MGTAGPPGNFDIHNLFKNPPQPGYNPPAPAPIPYPNPSHPFNNFPLNDYQPPNLFGSPTGPLSSSYPFMAQGSTYQQYPPYLQDQAPQPPLNQTQGFPQPPPSPPPSIPLFASRQPSSMSRPSSPSLDSARLMALLTNHSSGGLAVPTSLELPPSGVQASNANSEVSLPPAAVAPAVPSAPPVSLAPNSASGRLSSNKLPRGRHLKGEHIMYDVDVRLPGEAQPQLEVSPITLYVSDPVLLVGRQIAVNRSYICYGLRPNRHIRILNINTASRSLLRGHSERVTDMAFFAEDVHLLASASSDGRVFVRRIVEDPGEDNKLQITDQILLAVQFTGDWESVHPRVCWLCHTQEVLVVGMGKYVITIDMSKVRQTSAPNGFTTEEPVLCPVDNPIEGVCCVVGHHGEVTDLSTSQWTMLASASKDGTIRIWKDQNMLSLSILTPHDGQQVCAVAFLSAPHRSDHIVLLSAGPLNQELKLWVPAAGEGWFPQSGPVKWKCMQTLELKSSAGGRPEDAFFNQVLVVPRACVILLANAKRSALYVVHVDFGSNPSATRLNYLAEFSVVWPILSFTATSENAFDGDGILQVYCVQTQAIQQYSLDLSQCLPPVGETSMLATEKDLVNGFQVSSGSIANSIASTEASTTAFEVNSILRAKSPGPISGVSLTNKPLGVIKTALFGSSDDFPGSESLSPQIIMESSSMVDSRNVFSLEPETKELPTRELAPHISNISDPTPRMGGTALSPRASPFVRRAKSPIEDGPSLVGSPREHVELFCSYEHSEQSGERRIGSGIPSSPSKAVRDPFSLSPRRQFNDNMRMFEDSEWQLTSNTLTSSVLPELQSSAGSSVHLITPSQLMSMVARSKVEVDGVSTVSSPQDRGLSKEIIKADANSENHKAKVDSEALMVETKEMTNSIISHSDDNGYNKVVLAKSGGLISDSKKMDQTSTACEYSHIDTVREMDVIEQAHSDKAISEGTQLGDENEAVEEKEPLLRLLGGEACEQLQEVAAKVDDSPAFSVVSQARKKKNKNKTGTNISVGMTPSSSVTMSSVLASILSTSEQDSSNDTSSVTSPGLAAQITAMQDSLNQLVAMQTEFQKQMAVIVSVPVAKEVKRMEAVLGQRMERVLKAHMDAMWARLQEDNAKRENLEKDRVQQLSSFLSNSLSKDLPAAVERALKKEFSSIGPSVAHLVSPSIEKTISTAVNESFQKGISEKGVAELEKSVGAKIEASLSRQLQAQFQTSGKQALQEALHSCLEGSVIPAFESACQAMFRQVDAAFQKGISEHQAHAQQQFSTSHVSLASTLQEAVASATSLASSLKGELTDGQRRLLALVESTAVSRGAYSINNSLPDKAMTVQHVEESLDPTKELARLISERKLEEAFNKALSLTDVGVVSWLCNQVDLETLLTMTPTPLSQGVLLALVQQLGCDLGNDTGKKLMWIKDAALALNPDNPGLPPHVMRHFLEKLYTNLHALLATNLGSDLITMTRLVIHVVNSLLTSCK